MRIHKLVNEALKAVEAARDAKVAGLDHRPDIERANDILKNQIGKHPDRRAFFSNSKSPFFECYVELLRKVDEWMYPIHEEVQEPHQPQGTTEPAEDPGAEPLDLKPLERKLDETMPETAHQSTSSHPNTSQIPGDNHSIPLAERFAQIRRKSVPNSDRPRPPIPKLEPMLKMPEVPPPAPLPAKAPQAPPAPRAKAQDRGTSTVAAPILHKLLTERSDSILILDVRDRASYTEFHIDVPHTACLEFFSISKAENESDLEDSLVVAPKKDQLAFASRKSAKLVVLVDDHQDPHPEAIDRLKHALSNFKVVVLQGGIQAWNSYNLPLTRSTPSPEPPTPFTEQLVRDGTVVIRGGMIQSVPPKQQPIQLVNYPSVPRPSVPRQSARAGVGEVRYSRPGGTDQVNSGYGRPADSGYSRPADSGSGRPADSGYTRPADSGYNRPPPVPPHDVRVDRQHHQNHHHHQTHQNHHHQTSQNHHYHQSQPPSHYHPSVPLHSAPVQAHCPPSQLICGLKNLGNTCYMNCILQCLFGTNELIGPFLSGAYARYINPKSRLGYSGRLAHEFARLVAVVARSGQNQYVAGFEFKQLVGQLQDTFRGYDQQDCQEFLTFLLDGLHEDLNSRGDAPHEPALTEAQEKMRESYDVRVAAACEWERYMKTNASLVVDEIQGQYASRLECTVCHATSTTYTAFSTLTLPLKHKKSIDLSQCFDAFLSPAVLEGDNAWFCPRCQCKQKTIQYLKISRLPSILIIHLKRFRQKRSLSGVSTADKLETSVRYPLYHLDLTKYWTPVHELNERDARVWQSLPSRSQDPPFIYDLYAVTSHHGSLKSGHYTAFVRKESGWFYFDDTNVVPLRDNNVVTRNAYVLFYRRRENLR